MALGDIVVFKQSSAQGGRGSQSMTVAASAAVPLIYPGEPVCLVAGATSCIPGATNLLTIPSPFVPYSVSGTGLLGIAETKATNTATLAGSVDYIPADSRTVYLITAKVSATITPQATYDALVGHRVLIDLTSGVYTGLISDSALNGCIIRPLDVFKYPGKIAFSFLDGVSAMM